MGENSSTTNLINGIGGCSPSNEIMHLHKQYKQKPPPQNNNLDFSYTSNAGNSIVTGKGGGFFPNLRTKQRGESNAPVNSYNAN